MTRYLKTKDMKNNLNSLNEMCDR